MSRIIIFIGIIVVGSLLMNVAGNPSQASLYPLNSDWRIIWKPQHERVWTLDVDDPRCVLFEIDITPTTVSYVWRSNLQAASAALEMVLFQTPAGGGSPQPIMDEVDVPRNGEGSVTIGTRGDVFLCFRHRSLLTGEVKPPFLQVVFAGKVEDGSFERFEIARLEEALKLLKGLRAADAAKRATVEGLLQDVLNSHTVTVRRKESQSNNASNDSLQDEQLSMEELEARRMQKQKELDDQQAIIDNVRKEQAIQASIEWYEGLQVNHHIVEVDGHNIHVAEQRLETAEPVFTCILLHGFGEFWLSWRHVMALMARVGVGTLALDVRGSGSSYAPKQPDEYAVDLLMNDVIGVMDHFQLVDGRKVVLVGHDMGGVLAGYLSRAYSDRFLGIVNIGMPLLTNVPLQEIARGGDQTDLGYWRQEIASRSEEAVKLFDENPSATLRFLLSNDWSSRTSSTFANMTRFISLGSLSPIRPPPWLLPPAFQHYVSNFQHSGFFGSVQLFSAWDLNEGRFMHFCKEHPELSCLRTPNDCKKLNFHLVVPRYDDPALGGPSVIRQLRRLGGTNSKIHAGRYLLETLPNPIVNIILSLFNTWSSQPPPTVTDTIEDDSIL